MISINNAVKNYETTVIGEFNLVFEEKINLILGKNGAGKTTLINICLGIVKSDYGEVLFDNKKLKDVRSEIAFVFDEPGYIPMKSVLKNIEIMSQIKPNMTSIVYFLEKLNLKETILSMKMKDCSLGQRHKIAIIAALIRNPKYLFLDEPSLGLDIDCYEFLISHFKQMCENGTVIVITGHIFDFFKNVEINTYILKSGSLNYTANNVNANTLRELYDKYS